jgi:hypothetical protein
LDTKSNQLASQWHPTLRQWHHGYLLPVRSPTSIIFQTQRILGDQGLASKDHKPIHNTPTTELLVNFKYITYLFDHLPLSFRFGTRILRSLLTRNGRPFFDTILVSHSHYLAIIPIKYFITTNNNTLNLSLQINTASGMIIFEITQCQIWLCDCRPSKAKLEWLHVQAIPMRFHNPSTREGPWHASGSLQLAVS